MGRHICLLRELNGRHFGIDYLLLKVAKISFRNYLSQQKQLFLESRIWHFSDQGNSKIGATSV